MKNDDYTVSGPGVDRTYPDAGPALSAAITFATRATEECTFYVRNVNGDIYGRAERDEKGGIFVYRLRGGK